MHGDNREIYTGNNLSFVGRRVDHDGDVSEDQTDNSFLYQEYLKEKLI